MSTSHCSLIHLNVNHKWQLSHILISSIWVLICCLIWQACIMLALSIWIGSFKNFLPAWHRDKTVPKKSTEIWSCYSSCVDHQLHPSLLQIPSDLLKLMQVLGQGMHRSWTLRKKKHQSLHVTLTTAAYCKRQIDTWIPIWPCSCACSSLLHDTLNQFSNLLKV